MKKDFIKDVTIRVKYIKGCPNIIIKTSDYIRRHVDYFIANFENAFVCWTSGKVLNLELSRNLYFSMSIMDKIFGTNLRH